MPTEKRIYRAPSLEAHGGLRTMTSKGSKDDPTEFDSPNTNDLVTPS